MFIYINVCIFYDWYKLKLRRKSENFNQKYVLDHAVLFGEIIIFKSQIFCQCKKWHLKKKCSFAAVVVGNV